MDLRVTDKKRPGGIQGTERINVEDSQHRFWDTTLQEIANLASGFTPVAGNATIVNGSAIDIGGTMTDNITIDNGAFYNFRIENSTNNNHYWFNDDSVQIQYEANASNNYASWTFDYNDMVIDIADYVNNTYIYHSFQNTTTYARTQLTTSNNTGDLKLDMDTRNGITFIDEIGLGIFMPNLKSGIDQATAGASANEVWIDTADNSIKIGV